MSATEETVQSVESLRMERDQLKRWKQDMLTVNQWWEGVDALVRAHPSSRLGYSVADEAKRLIQERDDALRHAEVLHSLLVLRLVFETDQSQDNTCKAALRAFRRDFPRNAAP